MRVARGANCFGSFKWRVILLRQVQVALGTHFLLVRVARGANCFGSFKCRVIALPRAQVALGAHCLGCELLG